jgi:V8-like Glu-specific endopeptidase
MNLRSRSGFRRSVPLLASVACLLSAHTGTIGTAGAAVRVRGGGGAAASSALREAERVLRYWTPARMRNAPPLDAPGAVGGEAIADASFAVVPDTTATSPPYSANGRLFVRQGGRSGYCSATAINSPTRQLVLTAGHCVNSGPLYLHGRSVWSSYLEFVPAYSGGIAPFGAFVAPRNAIFAPKPWIKGGNSNFDVGVFLAMPNANGQNVADAVGGGATIVVDQDRHQTFQTFGYPGATRRLNTCTSPYTGDDRITYSLAGPPTMAIRCHWIPGASGGGWLIAGGTEIDGLTSYGLRNDKVHTFSPYFGSGNVGALVAGL